MLDNATALIEPAAAPNWRANLAVGDIVSYKFPVANEESGAARPKARPCLVIAIKTVAGERYAVLAYGTTASAGPNRGYEVKVRAPHAVLAAGLHKPTRFVCARRLMVPLGSDAFVCCTATGAPILGRLDGEERKRMNAVRTRLHAECDIAADRRNERRTRDRRSCASRPFTVELRRSKRHPTAAQEV